MPIIKPNSMQDLMTFIKEHWPDIENGTYDFYIDDDWVPKLSEDTLRVLIGHCPATHNVLASGALPLWASEILARNAATSVRQALAVNPNTHSSALAILAREQNFGIRRWGPGVYDSLSSNYSDIASHPNTHLATLEVLSTDIDEYVRAAVASNTNTPSRILEMLAKDNVINRSYGHFIVQEAVALNRNTPAGVLETLARHADGGVRCTVAINPNVPTAALEVLKKDGDFRVSKAALAGEKCFIASAVYDSELAPEVKIFREYRDRVLARYWSGQILIEVYYALSPRMAKFISNMPMIKSGIRRFILDPLVRIIRRKYPF